MLSINISLRHKVKYGFVVKKQKKQKTVVLMCYMNINEFFESLAGKILTAPLQKQTVSYFMCDLLAYTPSKKLLSLQSNHLWFKCSFCELSFIESYGSDSCFCSLLIGQSMPDSGKRWNGGKIRRQVNAKLPILRNDSQLQPISADGGWM